MKKEQYFETIKCDDFEVLNLNYHKKRVSNTIGKNISLEEYIYPPTAQLLKCKVIYNQDEIIDIQYSKYSKRVIKSLQIIENDNINYPKKSTNRDKIDNLFLQKNLSDDIIIIKNGLITDTSIANIALWYDNHWITPKTPLLYGTTRDRYIQDGTIKEYDITIDMLKQSKEIALLNAMVDFYIIDDIKIIY